MPQEQIDVHNINVCVSEHLKVLVDTALSLTTEDILNAAEYMKIHNHIVTLQQLKEKISLYEKQLKEKHNVTKPVSA